MSFIRIENVDKIYKNGCDDFYALKNCNLEIGRGDFIVIRGVSGSGKSTLLNILGTIDDPTNGYYYFDNILVNKLNDEQRATLRRDRIGFIFQDYMLVQKQTVLYNVMLPLMFGRDSLKICKHKALKALDKVGMSSFAKRKANTLSGGQRQRVAIARAIVNEPYLILADEPTGALDSGNTERVLDIIKTLNGTGITVVFVTHNDQISAPGEIGYHILDGVLSRDC